MIIILFFCLCYAGTIVYATALCRAARRGDVQAFRVGNPGGDIESPNSNPMRDRKDGTHEKLNYQRILLAGGRSKEGFSTRLSLFQLNPRIFR